MDTLFFVLSKLAWALIAPDSMLVLLFALGLVLLLKGYLRWAKYILSTLFALMLVISIFPVGEWLLYPLETKYQANPHLEKVDGIILLGGAEDPKLSAIWKQPVLGPAAERDFAFLYLAKKYPSATLVYTGGSGSVTDQEYKGADVAKQLFTQQGFDVSRILFERESRNTWENALFSQKLLSPKKGEHWVLITTGWHMPRSVGVFCQVGWSVTPYPVDFVSDDNLMRFSWGFSGHLHGLKKGIKEWVGILAYRFSGKMC